MSAQIWKCERLEVFHRPVRLPTAYSSRRTENLLPPWRFISITWQSRLSARLRQIVGSPTRRTDVRFTVVRPRWPDRLGYITTRSWLHLRPGHFGAIQPCEQPEADIACSSARHERIQITNILNRVSIGAMRRTSSQYSQRLTTATDAQTKQASWRSMRTWTTTFWCSTLHLEEVSLTLPAEHQTTSCDNAKKSI